MAFARGEARQKAHAEAAQRGYANVDDWLRAAYAAETPWAEVAQAIGTSKDHVAGWARELGLRRGARWSAAHKRTNYPTVGKAQAEPPKPPRPAHRRRRAGLPRAARLALIQAAERPDLSPVARAAALRSLARCGIVLPERDADPDGLALLALRPEEERWLGERHG